MSSTQFNSTHTDSRTTLESTVSNLISKSKQPHNGFRAFKEYILKHLNNTPRTLPKATLSEIIQICPETIQVNILKMFSIEKLIFISQSETSEFKQAAEEAILEQLNNSKPCLLDDESKMFDLLSSIFKIDISNDNEFKIGLEILLKLYLGITQIQKGLEETELLEYPLLKAKTFKQFLCIVNYLSCSQILKLNMFILTNKIDLKYECMETLLNLFKNKYLAESSPELVPNRDELQIFIKQLLNHARETSNVELADLTLELLFNLRYI